MAGTERQILISCEHAGHRVPARYRRLFRDKQALLRSHRGWDPGALNVARGLARAIGAPLLAATTTRLLVDLNRSPHNPRVFSEFTRSLPRESRDALLARHHRPHWDRVRAAISPRRGTTLHVAVHSFTPVWNGERRPFSIGILYDPQRADEQLLARDWQRALSAELTGRVRRNAPYRGDADGLTTAMRREYAMDRYLGIEVELNQRVLSDARRRRRIVSALSRLFARAR